jgi:small subunit ribosomal protein S6
VGGSYDQGEDPLYTYEAVFIYPSGADKLAAGKEAVAQEFAGAGIKVLSEEDMAERDLAYPIQGSDRGHYILYNVEAPDQAIGSLERVLRIKQGILRFHFYRQDPRMRQAKPAAAAPKT